MAMAMVTAMVMVAVAVVVVKPSQPLQQRPPFQRSSHPSYRIDRFAIDSTERCFSRNYRRRRNAVAAGAAEPSVTALALPLLRAIIIA
jgi:hypothetical protein